MAIKASAETIREMKKGISDTIKNIEQINRGIQSGLSSISDWDDSKANEFKSIMQQISSLTRKPVDTLNAALPKLEKLAQSLDDYNRTKIR